MACETFLKIAQKCKRKFVIKQDESDTRPFIEELLGSLPTIIQDLEPGQIHIVYESLGHIIQSQSEPNHRQQLLYALMELPNQSWTTVVTRAGQDMNSLFDQATVKMVISILKTNNRVAQAVGHGFIVQLGRIYLEMLQMYKMYSECISNEIASKGAVATQHVVVRNMRAVKKEALKLIETFVHNAQASDYESLIKNFVPALIDPVN
jgi:exportin-1